MSEQIWDAPIGDNAQFFAYIIGSNGKPITSYTGNEPVRVQVWPGEAQVALINVATITFDPPQALLGQTTVTIHGSATAALTPGYFIVRCEIDLPDGWYEFYSGWLNLKASPGATLPLPVYCSLQDIIDLASSWLPGLMSDQGLASFEVERAKARAEINRVILSRNRPYGWGWISTGYINLFSGEMPDLYIQTQLSLGNLIVTPEITQAAAYYTLALISEKQLTWDKDDVFFSRLRYFRAKYQQAITSAVAQIDVNGDGVADIAINLGRFSIR
jgi:hypothetical protein